jgi:hypothetical protein
VYFEAVSRNSHKILKSLSTEHDHPRCGRSVFKLYKIQTKSENHKTCRGVMLSHVEAMIKISKGLEQVATSNVQNPDFSTFFG